MNILFFLTPKTEVAYLYNDYTIGKALKVFQDCHYSAIPMIDRSGHYVGTVTEGDFLWGLYEGREITYENLHTRAVGELPLRVNHKAVYVDERMDNMLEIAKDQNFVPVVDDQGIFIGIVTRKEILKYCYGEIEKNWQEHIENE